MLPGLTSNTPEVFDATRVSPHAPEYKCHSVASFSSPVVVSVTVLPAQILEVEADSVGVVGSLQEGTVYVIDSLGRDAAEVLSRLTILLAVFVVVSVPTIIQPWLAEALFSQLCTSVAICAVLHV